MNREASLTRRDLLALGGVSVAALLAGCTTTGGQAGGDTGVFRYPLTSQPTTLDPAVVEDGTTIDLMQNIFEGLVLWNEQSEVAPGVAEKWDISHDGRTYTFHLRKGVKFHNGREVLADDFKYSIDRSCDPGLNSQTVFEYLSDVVGAIDCRNGKAKGVSGVKVLDPYTLQITILSPRSYFLDKLTYPTAYAVCREAIAQAGGKLDASSAVGCGPFRIASKNDYRSDYLVTLTAFGGYHGGAPKLKKIVRPVLLDATTRISKYEAGELDLVGVAPSDLDHINGDPKLKPDLHAFPRARIWYLALNRLPAGSPFVNKAVRVAFNMAIDKSEMARVALKSMMDPAGSIVPPGMGGYHPTCTPIAFNPAGAKAMLAQAGYGPGGKSFPTLGFSYRNDMPEVAAAAQMIANQLKTNLGIDIQPQGVEWGQLLKEMDAKSQPLVMGSWGADYLDPQDFLSLLLRSKEPENIAGYSNPAFDALCDRADGEQDQAKRFALYQQAEQMAISDAPWVPLYFQKDLELIKPRVQGIRDSQLGHLPYTTTSV